MKKFFFFAALLSSAVSFAQVQEQLTTADAPLVDALETMDIHYGGSSRPVEIGDDGTSVDTKVHSEIGVTAFSFKAKNSNGSVRRWEVQMLERARQQINIHIQDDFGNPTVGDSARLLETSLYFFPRRVVPAISSEDGVMKLVLPTGEVAEFDAGSKNLVGGVLSETAPLDMNFDRAKRKFAQIAYSGEGVMIRADRRSGMPETAYTQVYNVNEDIKNATITYHGKTCKVAKSLIWDQDDSKGFYFLYPTDQEFYEKVLTPKCGWTNLPL